MRNSSYIRRHCDHALKICMWLGYTPQINFCHFLYPATSKSAGYYVIPSPKNLRSSVRPSVRLSVRPYRVMALDLR